MIGKGYRRKTNCRITDDYTINYNKYRCEYEYSACPLETYKVCTAFLVVASPGHVFNGTGIGYTDVRDTCNKPGIDMHQTEKKCGPSGAVFMKRS